MSQCLSSDVSDAWTEHACLSPTTSAHDVPKLTDTAFTWPTFTSWQHTCTSYCASCVCVCVCVCMRVDWIYNPVETQILHYWKLVAIPSPTPAMTTSSLPNGKHLIRVTMLIQCSAFNLQCIHTSVAIIVFLQLTLALCVESPAIPFLGKSFVFILIIELIQCFGSACRHAYAHMYVHAPHWDKQVKVSSVSTIPHMLEPWLLLWDTKHF